MENGRVIIESTKKMEAVLDGLRVKAFQISSVPAIFEFGSFCLILPLSTSRRLCDG